LKDNISKHIAKVNEIIWGSVSGCKARFYRLESILPKTDCPMKALIFRLILSLDICTFHANFKLIWLKE